MLLNKLVLILGILLTSFFISSCDKKSDENTTQEKQTSTDEAKLERLKERALNRWNALIEQEWTTAYSYQTPSYRKNYTRKEFINSFGSAVEWRAVEVKSAKLINDKLAEVILVLNIGIEAGSASMVVPTNITEKWIYQENNWWRVSK